MKEAREREELAFGKAAIDLSPSQALERAEAFLAGQGYVVMYGPPVTRRSGILFSRSDAGVISTARIRSWTMPPRLTGYSVRQDGAW